MELSSPILLPFLIPAGVVVAFTTLQVTLLTLTGFAPGLEVDADIDLDADADLDADGDLDGASPGWIELLLTPLGVGQVPLSIVAQAFGLAWCVAGLTSSYALTQVAGPPRAAFLLATAPVSLLLAWAATRKVVRLVAPLLRVSGRAESGRDLVGRLGVVTSLRADAEYGEVRVQVNDAPSYVYVRTRGDVLPRGTQIEVVGYDVAAHRPLVAACTPSPSTSQGA